MESHRRICVSLVVVALLTVSGIGGKSNPLYAEELANPADPVPREMVAQDSLLSGAFTAVFEIRLERNLLGPDKGRHTKVCHYTASDAAVGLTVETQYEGDPPYHPVNTLGYSTSGYRPLDFDHDGNLIVWRSLRKVSLSTANFNRLSDEQEVLTIAPSGEVVGKARGPTLYEYAVGSRANFYEFDQFRMAAGRGFTSQIEKLKAQRTLVNGIQQLVFDAPFGPEVRADWYLYVDPENNNLVRQADRFSRTFKRPSLHMENRGVIRKDGLTLAMEGSLSYALDEQQDYILKVTVVEFSAQADQKHLDQIRPLVTGPFPPGTDVRDHRALFPPR